jgi:fucose permease
MLVPSASGPTQQARSSASASSAKQVDRDMDESVLEYGVLRVPAAIACMLAHASCNNLGYTLTQWAPTYYASVLGCDALATGKHLAVTGVVRFVGNFLGATLETSLQKLGIKQLTIRRSVCLINNTIQAMCCLGFGLSKTPLTATLMNCGVCLCDCFQGIGFSQNYYEVGGPDTAILTSVGNVFASLGGMIAPALGAWLLASTGQWYPLYAIAAAIHVVAGVFFAVCASDTPARQLLYGAAAGTKGVEGELRQLMMGGRGRGRGRGR